MDWVEVTAKSIEAARHAALEQLGVGAHQAEFDVIEEPRAGLFGRMRGEARLRGPRATDPGSIEAGAAAQEQVRQG
jgi:predicted RNA-binding protein Jag